MGDSTTSDGYDAPHLRRRAANHAPLSPLSFLARAAAIYPDKIAVIHGATQITYGEFYARCVAIMAPNIPAMLEAHYGVAMAGGVLNALNYRLDARSIAFILDHGGAKIVLADREFSQVMSAALALTPSRPLVIDIDDPAFEGGAPIGEMAYEAFLATGHPEAAWSLPDDEWQAIALGYTSGTTGNPKGVVAHHRGAFLNAMGNAIAFGLSAQSVYLWTLPMFHCNGWTYTWAVTAVCGTHVCLRRVESAAIFAAIAAHRVTHLCGAPIVLTMLIHAPDAVKRRFAHTVEVATGGAAPPFRVTHLYGLTECYGPATLCAWQDAWEGLPLDERAGFMARQGVRYPTLEAVRIVDPATMTDMPADGETIGELVLRGNTVMKGYLKNPAATQEAFAGGWFHTGDLGVMHQDGYVEIKDRAKDIIISGGENISSLEVEEVLYRHPCAFVMLKPGGTASTAELTEWCRANLAHFKVPKTIIFGALPKTSTGKIQKFALRDQAREL